MTDEPTWSGSAAAADSAEVSQAPEESEQKITTSRRGATIVAAVVFVAIAVAYGVEASQLARGAMARPGPGLFPLFVVTPALLLGAVGLLVAARNEQGYVDWPGSAGWVRVAIVVGAAAGYAAAAPMVGHAVCAGLLGVVLLSVFGLYNVLVRLIVSAVLAVGSDVLFTYLLGSPLPRGPFGWYW